MKNAKKVKKEILNSNAGYEPCVCTHMRISHLGEGGTLCFGCFVDKKEIKREYKHTFKLDNLTYIEKLYNKKTLEKFKNGK